MKKKWIYLVPLAILGVLLFIALGGEIVRQLWNWLLPPLFGWHQLTFWEALGMLALCRILFGGLGSHGGSGPKFGRRKAERWEAMTPEERERLRQNMRERCGFGPSTTESTGQ
ncbi:MAG: hypothetical protein ACLQKA_05745 [Bryobacteraceae bacterium]